MNKYIRDIAIVFSAGAFGGLMNSIAVWGFGTIGITALFGVLIAPPYTQSFVYPKIVWGGIWGVLFLMPFMRKSIFWRGVIFSVAPSLVQLFLVFPLQAKKGMMGLDLGMLTPLFVFIFNAIWGWSAVLVLKLSSTD